MLNNIDLLGGIVVKSSLNENHYQDYVEIRLLNGDTILLTSSPSGKFKIGKKIVDVDNHQ